MASNRSGGIRDIKDSQRGQVLGLPVTSKKVTRRVAQDQVSTYHMSVHERQNEAGSNPIDLLKDRNRDPGEVESLNLDKNSKSLIAYLTAHKRAMDLFEGSRRKQMGELQAGRLANAVFGKLIGEDRFDEARDMLFSSGFNLSDLQRTSASTWRHFLKQAPVQFIEEVARKKFPNQLFLGEMSVLSNSLLRRGVNTLYHVLPAAKEILKDIEYVDLPNQQLFNLSGLTVPSRVDPVNRNFVNVVDTAGAKWVYTKARKSKWIKNFLENYSGTSIRVGLQGFPAKADASSNILQVSSHGLSNSQIQIGPDDILDILGGFSVFGRKSPKDRVVMEEDQWPHNSTMIPLINDKEMDPIGLNVRGRLTKFANKVSKPNDIESGITSVGVGEHGVSELDIRDSGNHYTWDSLRRNSSKPYRMGTEADLFATTYPHPLVKYNALKYLGNTGEDVLKRLGDMSVVTLPQQKLKQTKPRGK